jgi:hypothetical protein
MRKPDPTPHHLTPITPPIPLTRWAVDHTGPLDGFYLLNAIEYATGWAESSWVADQSAVTTNGFLEGLRLRFGPIREIISDNGTAFVNTLIGSWLQRHGIKHLRTSPIYPRTNGRVERFNGVLKEIIQKLRLEEPTMPRNSLLSRALHIYNRRPGTHGYSPYFLLHGCSERSTGAPQAQYVREPTDEEETAFAHELAREHAAADPRRYVASLKASRDVVRSRLQEKKALFRVFMVGDWVLRARKRGNKFEPYYDGPWMIRRIHDGNNYSLASPGGIELQGRINGLHLYPAYVTDGHPERSLWYANRTLLEADRRRQLGEVGLEPMAKEATAREPRSNGARRSPDLD